MNLSNVYMAEGTSAQRAVQGWVSYKPHAPETSTDSHSVQNKREYTRPRLKKVKEGSQRKSIR